MPNVATRADSIREYLTGAASENGTQTDPTASLGGFRSSTEAASLSITVNAVLSGVTVLFAGGNNPLGGGILATVDGFNFTWTAPGANSSGPAVLFSNNTRLVEAANTPSQFLRVTVATPTSPGQSNITLGNLVNNVFGFANVNANQALLGADFYWSVMLRNECPHSITDVKRWIQPLANGTQSDLTWLGASGAGTIQMSGNVTTWPESGWLQVRSSGGTLKEVVYYASRSGSIIPIASGGRGLLGTSPASGTNTDLIYPVPGVAIGIDAAGVQAFNTSIQTVANLTTAPVGITWNLGLTAAAGLSIGTLGASTQVGIWIWRQLPPNTEATPLALTKFSNSFSAF